MKIYNQDKTQELLEAEIDFTLGQLVDDKLFVAHHEAVAEKKGKTAQEVAAEYEAQGKTTREIGGKLYVVTNAYNNGGEDVEEIASEPDTPAREAYDEYEDIQVYVPYSAEEIEERRKAQLRAKRTPLLAAFDKWEKAVLRGREEDSESVMNWYKAILDLDDNAFEAIPARIEYYL
jgi:hypothetical protein